ncbi:hypothetical protein ACN26Y_30035 [Micromonospora sp. WMMD558]|uniref:hypothetical protein n=1 Tax=unclassified Micromonospora TaxID=2617518 RepID=UPI0012B4D6C1|nr:hypothetical protein [Micromonospora sp. WMMC415]QGN50028.1 hypothetical protein GKC29_26540 [Micromonospora sp. WMMC415]
MGVARRCPRAAAGWLAAGTRLAPRGWRRAGGRLAATAAAGGLGRPDPARSSADGRLADLAADHADALLAGGHTAAHPGRRLATTGGDMAARG